MTTPAREYKYKRVTAGSRVGRLVVREVVGRSKNGSKIWNCSCICGKFIRVVASSLNSGLCQSCGCLYQEVAGKQKISHGQSDTPTYNSWLAMKQRCYYEDSDYYQLYGGRGIKVCDRWRGSFECFLADMGHRPDDKTLDRIDTDRDYSPENCRWASNSLQGYNTRTKVSNSSGRTGVYWHKATSKWSASIGYENKSYHLGVFSSLEEAKTAREKAEIKFFGFLKEN